MRLRLLATLAVFIWIPAARANTIVWFEAVPITPFTGVCWQGGGQTLQLCYPDGLFGVLSWQVSMKAALGEGGVTSWSLDLRTAPGNGVSLLYPQITPSPFTEATSPGTPGTGPSLLQTAHGWTFSQLQPQTVTLLTFTLRRTVAFGDFSHAYVFGGPSADGQWGPWANYTTGDYEVVQFGPNPRMPGIEGTVGALPLIHLFPYPEPSSLTLLVLGGAVCLRRPRSVE